jgi:hypothetical protein
MIDVTGPFLLILILSSYGGIAIQEMPNYESCRAAIVQLEPVRNVRGYCIAKEVKK